MQRSGRRLDRWTLPTISGSITANSSGKSTSLDHSHTPFEDPVCVERNLFDECNASLMSLSHHRSLSWRSVVDWESTRWWITCWSNLHVWLLNGISVMNTTLWQTDRYVEVQQREQWNLHWTLPLECRSWEIDIFMDSFYIRYWMWIVPSHAHSTTHTHTHTVCWWYGKWVVISCTSSSILFIHRSSWIDCISRSVPPQVCHHCAEQGRLEDSIEHRDDSNTEGV